MASTFSFGFDGDDIDTDMDIDQTPEQQQPDLKHTRQGEAATIDLIPATLHRLDEWVIISYANFFCPMAWTDRCFYQTSILPSQISYNTLTLPIKRSKDGAEGKFYLGRREVFDIRAQLMAEDDDEDDEQSRAACNDPATAPGTKRIRNETLISGLEKGDLTPRVYEGGFKTWECAVYLASFLLKEEEGAGALWKTVDNEGKGEEGEEECVDQIIELGCGSAMPSLALFARLLQDKHTRKTRRRTRFVLADYNDVVLRMVTVPNFILTWWLNRAIEDTQPHQDNSEEGGGEGPALEGELDIDASLLEAFTADLADAGITIDLISGAWSASFVELASRGVPGQSQAGSGRTLVLASETVYSPDSLVAFSDTLLEFLRWPRSHALIAAKKVYFGVGGGVDEFLHVLHQRKNPNEDVDAKSVTETSADGVGRTILQVQIKTNTPGIALANS